MSPVVSHRTFSVDTKPVPGDILSPTQVSTVMDCAYRWYAKYVLELPDPPTGSLSLGKAVHTALGANFAQKCETKVDLPVLGVVALFREAWAVACEQTEFRDDENPAELGNMGEILVAKYIDEAAPLIEPVSVEIHVQGVIAGVRVQGYADLLDVEGRVIDIKTAKARPSSIDPMHKFQVATYQHLIPGATGTGRIDTLVKTKATQLIQQSFSITLKELRAIHTLYPAAQEVMRGCTISRTGSPCCAAAGIVRFGDTANRSGAGRFRKHETPAQPQVSRVDSNSAVCRMRVYSMD